MLAEQARHIAQYFIAFLMTKGIVNNFEMIQVHVHQRVLGIGAHGIGGELCEGRFKKVAIV